MGQSLALCHDFDFADELYSVVDRDLSFAHLLQTRSNLVTFCYILVSAVTSESENAPPFGCVLRN